MSPDSLEPTPNRPEMPPASARAAMRAALERELDLSSRGPSILPSIPDHELLQRIGTGAYGEVWMARNALGSLRAIKVVYRDRFDEERPFQREFHGILRYEPVSRTHPGLVAILHVGRNQESEYFYYVMELADPATPRTRSAGPSSRAARIDAEPDREGHAAGSAGPPGYTPRTLRSELLGRHRLPPVDAASLALQLAGALEHLHSHGLVHRDIKPSNVIFVGGQPKLADIGLVTGAGDSRSFVGTEGFIPPEGPGMPGADLYGLGKLLYELAVGRDRLDFPQLPPELSQLPERESLLELNEVITRACAPDPAQRYACASRMAADLKLFLAGHSLRLVRKQERHLAWFKQLALVASLLVCLAFTALWLARRETRRAQIRELESRRRAEEELALRRRAEAAEREARQELYSALFEQARTAVTTGEIGHRVRALEALSRAAAISNSVELRREALRALALPDLQLERELPLPTGFTLAQLDRHFQRLAVCSGTGPVEIRSAADNHLLQSLPASANRRAFVARWSSDGRFLAVKRDREDFEEHADVEVWDLSLPRQILLLTNTAYGAFDFHPRLPRLIVGTSGANIETWDLHRRLLIGSFKLEENPNFLTVAHDGERLAACCKLPAGWTVTINLLTNGLPLLSHRWRDRLEWLDWHPNDDWLAVPDFSGAVNLWHTRTGALRLLGKHKAQAVMVAFSPDGSFLVSGGWEREQICWDLHKMTQAFTITVNSFLAQFPLQGSECAILDKSSVRFYRVESPSLVREFPDDLGGRLHYVLFSPDGHWLAATGQERLGVWDLTNPGPAALLPEAADAHLYFSGSGRDLFASDEANCFHWQISPPTNAGAPPILNSLPLTKPQTFMSLAAASNRLVFTASRGSQVVDIGRPLPNDHAWKPTLAGVSGISPGGRWLGIYRPYTSVLALYSLPELKPVAELNARANFNSFVFSPLENEVAVGSPNEIEFWSTRTWQRTREITNYMRLLYSADGASLWLTKDYRTAALCDARTITPLLPLPSGMLPLAVSADSRYFAVSVDARRLQVWDLAAIHDELRKLGIDWSSSPQAQAPPGTQRSASAADRVL